MATKPIRRYIKEKDAALKKAEASAQRVIKDGSFGYQLKTEDVRKYAEKQDDVEKLLQRKPKGMSDQEWVRQIESGEAMVQNFQRSKRTKPSVFSHGLKKVKASGPKNPKDFVMTTVREPKLLKKAAKARARRKKK